MNQLRLRKNKNLLKDKVCGDILGSSFIQLANSNLPFSICR